MNPDLTIEGMRKILKERYGVAVLATKLYRARCKGKGDTLTKHAAEFVVLRCYVHMVLKTNPGSLAKIKSKVVDTDSPPVFERIFIAFHGCVAGFIAGCRPFIGFDGCHLKGAYGGVLLSAIGLDANLQFFPVCVAIVENENKDSWKWFLNKLTSLISIVLETKKVSVISDRQKVSQLFFS